MSEFVGYVVSGLVTGAIYALLASGLVLAYSASGVLNFAHGATAFLSALVFYELNQGLGWPAVPAALFTVFVFAPGLGWALDAIMFRRLARLGETPQIVATIGLLVALPAMGLWAVKLLTDAGVDLVPAENQYGLPGVGPNPPRHWEVMDGVGIDSNQLITWIVTAVVAVGLWVLMRHTPLGLRLRASVDSRTLTELRGVSADRLSGFAWMLSAGLAGAVGVLAVPLLALSSSDYTLLLFVSAAAAVLGRFVSVPVAFAGGLLLGVVQNLVAGYAPSWTERITGFRTAVPFILLFVGLLVLSRGRRSAGTAAVDAPPPDYLAGMPVWRRWAPWVASGVFLAVSLYTWTTAFWIGLIAQGLAASLVFLSFTVVTGLGGMVSLAQATFVMASALTAGLLMSHGVPFLVALVVGTVVAALLGVVVALPALRLSGRMLALATLALAFLGDQVLFQMRWLRNGDEGWEVPRPVVGPVDLSDDRALALFLLVVVALVVVVIRNLEDSASGRAMLAVRSAPPAAMASGVSVVRTKLALFAISAGIAGFGGVFLASFSTRVTATDYTAMNGLVWLAIAVAAGVRRPQFAVVAGLTFSLFPHIMEDYVTDSPHLPVILFGLAGLALAGNPEGYIVQLTEGLHALRAKAVRRGSVPDPARAAAVARKESVTPAPAEASSPGHAADAEVLLRLRGVRAGYGDVEVLHGVDLDIRAGSITALLGANGAGKTTTCAVAAGLLTPSAGSVELAAGEGVFRDVTRLSAVRRSRDGVLLAPEGRGIFPSLTIDENLAMWLRSGDERDRAYERFPDLAARRKVAAGALSGGEQQQLTMAPLLVRPPRVLIADEPSLGLAPLVVDEIFRFVVELRDRGVALLLVEEKAAEILTVADTVAFMRVGTVSWTGPRDEVDENRLTSAYLGLAAEEAPRDRDRMRGRGEVTRS
ncbi:ATP-binding cassette domain-containing protein [Yinghuangia sp. ASG 101]|uniref:ABC transporter permease subunit n=1 Tax=Yinghuangia sp. ASG 101 TaxID=2896848 RepID=UPI001E64B6B5|nr:ATP-binding cassette domain-containing protein [Yinghuangia sp. ASG 101]UGQ15071.1 ATP-binding cassette domain-containing protein [Yinghuangia sp. ASG 101]